MRQDPHTHMTGIKKLLPGWPIVILAIIIAGLFWINYVPNTYLTGWDNLHPEYYFWLNIKRSLFAVWQEYQGLGLLGGMGHASDLIHQIILLGLAYFMPDNLLRYSWTFMMLFAGSIGAYFLIYFIHQQASKSNHTSIVSFLGALFYLLNLSTVQTFYAPFEAFIAHFATLPWLLLASLKYYDSPSRKQLIFLITVLFLATPASYIPTLFLVYLITLSLILFVINLISFVKYRLLKAYILKTLKLYLIIFLVNSFWLLPFMYFTLTNSSVTLNSKINQMATETIFAQNKEFGTIHDVMLLKGFWFNNLNPDQSNTFSPMLKPWIEHLNHPLVLISGYLLFAVIILGFITSLRSKNLYLLSFCVLAVFAFTMLVTSTPPFSFINILFRELPLFQQAFRFPFTKFSILASLAYALFFAFGSEAIIKKIKALPTVLFLLFLITVFMLPVFQGHLFYVKERLFIPNEYSELFDFFKKQDPNTRVANFPQHTFWGWNFYNWGYSGSGFLWYGIQQPILDRAFDVWSKTDENYYFELSYALYKKDPVIFENVVNKYQITWLLLDKNIINPQAPQALFTKDLQQLINSLPAIHKDKNFGNLELYKVDLKDKPTNFVFIDSNLKTVNGYQSNDHDLAYQDNGNYISTADNPALFYPFRSLFTGKTQAENEFNMKETPTSIDLTTSIPPLKTILVPSLFDTESIIASDIYTKKDGDNLLVEAALRAPQVLINRKIIWGDSIAQPLFSLPSTLLKSNQAIRLNINGVVNLKINQENANIATAFLSLKEDNFLTLVGGDEKVIGAKVIQPKDLKSLGNFGAKELSVKNINQTQTFTVKIPKIDDNYASFTIDPNVKPFIKNCDSIRKGAILSNLDDSFITLFSKNATACIEYYAPNLSHQEGYAILVPSETVDGRSLHFWVLNDDQKNALIDTYLSPNKKKSTGTFVLPPQDQFGRSYSFHFENISIGGDKTTNRLGKVTVYPIPYLFLTSLRLFDKDTTHNIYHGSSKGIEVKHPNESLYILDLKKPMNTNDLIILSQSYDPGWKAYEIANLNWPKIALTMIFGTEIKNHVMVNNWENGWIPSNSTLEPFDNKIVIILYLPQYLEYLGFIFLFALIPITLFDIL